MSEGKTSTTAYIVTASIAKLSHTQPENQYIPEEMGRIADIFMANACDSWLKKMISLIPIKFLISLIDIIFIPGMVHHFLFRKLYIAGQAEEFIEQGGKQVIVLGAGFDSLALRFAKKYPAINFFEVDLPVTQKVKLLALAKAGFQIPANCKFISADLAKTKLAQALSPIAGFASAAPTMIILEGVLMYLPENAVKSLFSDLHNLFEDSLTITFGATVAPDSEGNLLLRLTNFWLAKSGEATHWHCPSLKMADFLKNLGFELKDSVSYKLLQEPYRSAAEIKAIPQEDENYYTVAKKALA